MYREFRALFGARRRACCWQSRFCPWLRRIGAAGRRSDVQDYTIERIFPQHAIALGYGGGALRAAGGQPASATFELNNALNIAAWWMAGNTDSASRNQQDSFRPPGVRSGARQGPAGQHIVYL